MNKSLLIVLVLFTFSYGLEEMGTEKRVKEVIKTNEIVKKKYEIAHKFLGLYKNTLTGVERSLLLQKELVWQKSVERCLEDNSIECLTNHYSKITTILKDEYIKKYGLITLGNVSTKLWKHYNKTMTNQKSEIHYNNKHQKNTICLGEEHQQITKGTVYLTRFYNKVSTLFHGKNFSDKEYCEDEHTREYKHQPLIAYILKKYSKKILKEQIVLGLKMLKNEDRMVIHKSLKKLDEMYLYYLNHTNVTEESIFRLNERKNVCNYVMYNGEANHGHVIVLRLLDKPQASLQLHSVVDYMYTFWHRRNMDGSLEKSSELLGFTLDRLEEIK